MGWAIAPGRLRGTQGGTQGGTHGPPATAPLAGLAPSFAGGSHEGYVKWACASAVRRSWRAVALNLRGCNGLPLTSGRGYNAIQTTDVHIAVASIKGCAPPLCPAARLPAGADSAGGAARGVAATPPPPLKNKPHAAAHVHTRITAALRVHEPAGPQPPPSRRDGYTHAGASPTHPSWRPATAWAASC